MAQSILLTIAIPTYNGERYIQDTLREVLSQASAFPDTVEVIVSDNASTDSTPAILKELQKEHTSLRSFRNDSNLGADANFDLSFQRASGKYVWLLGDDDIPEDGALKKIIEVIDKADYSVLFLNWSNWSEDMSTRYHDRAISDLEDKVLQNGNEYLQLIKLNSIFVSANVVNKDLWNSTESLPFIGSNWIQYAKVLRAANKGPSYFVAQPYVRYRSSGQRYQKCGVPSLENSRNLLRIMDGLEGLGYDQDVVDSAKRVAWANLPLEIVLVRIKGVMIPWSTFNGIRKPLLLAILMSILMGLPDAFFKAGFGRPTSLLFQKFRNYWIDH